MQLDLVNDDYKYNNAGSLGLTVSGAMLFGLIALMFLDTSINMAMQPFKMLVVQPRQVLQPSTRLKR